ncbi:MAG: ABC transporter ATP-binding protein [Balneolaceae bacterium]
MEQESILQVRDLTKTYLNGGKSLTVLDQVTFAIEPGISCAVVGPSGSGKTTLLGLCAGLDQPTSGEVFLKGERLNPLSEDQLARIRNRHIGFVFQSFQLIPTLTAIENVMVPMELRGIRYASVYEKAKKNLDETGLGDRLTHYPTQLSGGEQQRVGIARAFINQPDILFADEPTGNLDTETSRSIESLLFNLNRKQGTTLVIVTHDLELAGKCDRVIRLKGGRIDSDRYTSDLKSVTADLTVES